MPFEQIPYTNFHGTNQDWMIQQIKQMIATWASYQENFDQWRNNIDAAFTSLHDYVYNYFDNLDVAEEINNKLDVMASDGSLTALIAPYLDDHLENMDTTINAQNVRLNTLEQELDNFISQQGTPSGNKDPELTDIRVGYNGLTYPTAGDAVRGQVEALTVNINELRLKEGNLFVPVTNGYYKTTDSKIAEGTTPSVIQQRTISGNVKDLIPVGTLITSSNLLQFAVWFTQADDTVIDYTTWHTYYEIPATYNDQEYAKMFITFKNSDDSTLAPAYVYANSLYTLPYYDNFDIDVEGPFFCWISNNKLYLRGLQNSRIHAGRKIINGANVDYNFAIPDSRLYYLTVDYQGNFSLKLYSSVTANDHCVARVYSGTVYTDHPTIIINRIPLVPLYWRTDIPVFINNDRLGYKVMPSTVITPERTRLKFKDTFRLVNPSGNIRLDEGNSSSVNVLPNSTWTQNTFTLSDEKILMVGDSITNRGWIQRRIKEYAPNVQFLGTQTTGIGIGINDYKCEAYPGATAAAMISQGGSHSAINGNYHAYIVNELDNEVPDIVIIEFGLNEQDAASYRSNVQMLIDQIRENDTQIGHTTKVYVTVPFTRALSENNGYNYNLSYAQIYAGRQCTLEAWSLTNCVLIPTHMIFDDRYDYVHADLTAYGYGVTVNAITDFVHPSEAVGFLKLADTIYSYLGV